MSLNKTLDRLFDEIRREAKRNPAFADRLDAVLRLHESRRDVDDETLEDVAQQSARASGGGGERREAEGEGAAKGKRRAAPAEPAATAPTQKPAPPAINPAGLYKRAGEDALTEALAALDLGALKALVAEHNLDPSGAAAAFDAPELVTHIVAQAKKRAERDEKMFDY